MARRYRKESDAYRADSAAAGAVAGVIAGACMAVLLMIVSAAAGMGFWHPLALAGGLFYGVNAILDGIGPVLTGVIAHLSLTAVLGAIFGSLLSKEQGTVGRAAGWGLLYGIPCWAVTTYILLPLLNPTMGARVDLAPGWWFLSFLTFGFVLGVTPIIRQAIGRDLEEPVLEERPKAAA
jgi:hypothetical protein